MKKIAWISGCNSVCRGALADYIKVLESYKVDHIYDWDQACKIKLDDYETIIYDDTCTACSYEDYGITVPREEFERKNLKGINYIVLTGASLKEYL